MSAWFLLPIFNRFIVIIPIFANHLKKIPPTGKFDGCGAKFIDQIFLLAIDFPGWICYDEIVSMIFL